MRPLENLNREHDERIKKVKLEDGITSYDCQKCGKSCLEKSDIQRHIKENHTKKLTEGKERASGTKKQKNSKIPVLNPDSEKIKCCKCPKCKEIIFCGCDCHKTK